MQSTFRSTASAIVGTLAISIASLLLGALVFLCGRNLSEPPATALLVGLGSFLIGDCYFGCEGRTIRKGAAIILGAIIALALSPEVGGRFDSKVDELYSMDRLHFGAVSIAIAGGTLGSIAELLCRAWGRRYGTDDIADSSAADEF